MQIIQPLLVTQVNPLGQKSYLGYQHNIKPKPLIITKPIFQPSKLLLARKRQPFIDTLIADGDNFAIPDIEPELSAIELDKSNSIPEINIQNGITNIKFKISHVSNLLQNQIASNLNQEILTEVSPQTTVSKNKNQPKKSSQSKSVNQSKIQKATKSSNSKRKTKVIDQASSISNTNESNLLTTDSLQSKLEHTSTIQQLNLENKAIDISTAETISSDLADDLTLLRKVNSDESSVIYDLPSILIDAFSDDVNDLKKEILNQNIDISNSKENKTLETETYQNNQDINRIDKLSDQHQAIDNETQQNIDNLINPGYLENNEYPNFTQPNTLKEINEISPASIPPKPESHLLYSHNNINGVPKELSNTALETSQDSLSSTSENNNSLIETEPLVSEIISPKFENIPNLSTYSDNTNTQKKQVAADVNYVENKAESIDSDNISNTINTPKIFSTNTSTTESINTEAVELADTAPIIESRTNSFTTPEEELTTVTPVIKTAIAAKIEEDFTPELTTIQPDTISNPLLENEDINTTELTTVTPVITSAIAAKIEEDFTPELTTIQPDTISNPLPENEDINTTELTTVTPVITSAIAAKIEEDFTPELTTIQPETTSNTSPEIEDTNTAEITAFTPVITSVISPQLEEDSTPNSNITNSETTDIPLTNITKTEDILTFSEIIHNEQPIQSEASLAIDNLDLSNFVTTLDTSENTFPPDNVDNTSSIDIEPAAILNNLPAPKGYATGGQVTATSIENHQPVAPSDTVPAMLTPGEFVINAKDAQKNLQILQHINTGGLPEELISPSLEVTTPPTPEINSSEPTTKVYSFQETPVQRQSTEPDTSPEPIPLNSPSLGMEIGKQRRSLLNHPQIDTIENTTHVSPETSPHYSSPSLIFRKTNSTTNTQTPSQWSSVEELLNANHDEFSNFNFGGLESNWQNSQSFQFASSSTPTQIFTKRLPTPQGFANGGEVIAPDISRDIVPVTETIQSPLSSSPTEGNDDNDDEKLEALAQAIYYRLRQRIEIERERQGIYVGSLPW